MKTYETKYFLKNTLIKTLGFDLAYYFFKIICLSVVAMAVGNDSERRVIMTNTGALAVFV